MVRGRSCRRRASATIDVGAFDASSLTVTISGIDPRTAPEDFSGLPRVLPVGLAELQLGGVAITARNPDEALGDSCRGDLLTIDAAPVELADDGPQASGLRSAAAVLARAPDPVDALGEYRRARRHSPPASAARSGSCP